MVQSTQKNSQFSHFSQGLGSLFTQNSKPTSLAASINDKIKNLIPENRRQLVRNIALGGIGLVATSFALHYLYGVYSLNVSAAQIPVSPPPPESPSTLDQFKEKLEPLIPDSLFADDKTSSVPPPISFFDSPPVANSETPPVSNYETPPVSNYESPSVSNSETPPVSNSESSHVSAYTIAGGIVSIIGLVILGMKCRPHSYGTVNKRQLTNGPGSDSVDPKNHNEEADPNRLRAGDRKLETKSTVNENPDLGNVPEPVLPRTCFSKKEIKQFAEIANNEPQQFIESFCNQDPNHHSLDPDNEATQGNFALVAQYFKEIAMKGYAKEFIRLFAAPVSSGKPLLLHHTIFFHSLETIRNLLMKKKVENVTSGDKLVIGELFLNAFEEFLKPDNNAKEKQKTAELCSEIQENLTQKNAYQAITDKLINLNKSLNERIIKLRRQVSLFVKMDDSNKKELLPITGSKQPKTPKSQPVPPSNALIS